MTKEVKQSAKVLSTDTKTAIRNFVRLIESAALLTVALYAGYAAHLHNFTGLYKLLTIAAVLIGLRGAELFMRHLANK